MHCIKAEYPEDWTTANIYILSDLHVGDPRSDLTQIQEMIDQVKNDPNGLAVLNGDLMNTALKNTVSDVYGEIMRPVDQILSIVNLMRPIKDKIIGVDAGNHELRVYKNDGIDIMRLACRELGIESRYHPDGVLIFLKFGQRSKHHSHKSRDNRQQFVIYATHGAGGGRKEGAKAIRLADMAAIVDADIYIHSHTHLPMVMRKMFYRTDTRNFTATECDRLFVNSAASLDFGGYAQQQEYSPSSKRTPVIHLNAYTGTATATL